MLRLDRILVPLSSGEDHALHTLAQVLACAVVHKFRVTALAIDTQTTAPPMSQATSTSIRPEAATMLAKALAVAEASCCHLHCLLRAGLPLDTIGAVVRETGAELAVIPFGPGMSPEWRDATASLLAAPHTPCRHDSMPQENGYLLVPRHTFTMPHAARAHALPKGLRAPQLDALLGNEDMLEALLNANTPVLVTLGPAIHRQVHPKNDAARPHQTRHQLDASHVSGHLLAGRQPV